MSKKFLLAAGLLCICASSAPAHEITMGTDSILQRVASYNSDVKASKSNYEAVRQGISVAESAKLPTVTASLDINYLGDGTILDRDFSNAMRDKLPHFGNTLSVTLYQPIYQGGAISAGIDLARLKADMAAIGIAQQTEMSAIEALASYFNLMKMRNLRKVYAENIAITEKLIAQMKERHSQGAALKNDVTRYELRLSSLKYDLLTVDNSISVLNNNLVSLLGSPDETIVIPRDIDDLPPMQEEALWQASTATESNELKAIDKSRQLAKTGLRLERARRLPSVGVVIGDQLLGPVTFEVPAINKNYNAWFAGLSVKYNLSSLWTTSKKERQHQLEVINIDDRRDAMTDALSRRVHEYCVALQQAYQMLETEELNVRLANENYNVVETRFHNDMALLTDMLDASTAKLDSETRLVNSRINYLLAYYQLKFISGTLYKL